MSRIFIRLTSVGSRLPLPEQGRQGTDAELDQDLVRPSPRKDRLPTTVCTEMQRSSVLAHDGCFDYSILSDVSNTYISPTILSPPSLVLQASAKVLISQRQYSPVVKSTSLLLDSLGRNLDCHLLL